MIEIIPAIMTESDEEFVRMVHILERAGVKRVHLDITDGMFVPRRTIKGYEQLRRLNTSLIFDVHLMVSRPEMQSEAWAEIPNASRLIVHVEATGHIETISAQVHAAGKEFGAAINPESHISRLEGVLRHLDFVQFMTVHPGAQGRTFVQEALDHLTEFHNAHPQVPVMVDGGITPVTAPLCAHAGATHLVSGSYVMRATDAGRALRELEAVVVQ